VETIPFLTLQLLTHLQGVLLLLAAAVVVAMAVLHLQPQVD
jgi:hypothetical protein